MNNEFDKYLGIANHNIQMANTNQELKSYVASILYDNDKKDKEIDRLNNIINELENYCWELKTMGCREGALDMLDKIKELKEENK